MIRYWNKKQPSRLLSPRCATFPTSLCAVHCALTAQRKKPPAGGSFSFYFSHFMMVLPIGFFRSESNASVICLMWRIVTTLPTISDR